MTTKHNSKPTQLTCQLCGWTWTPRKPAGELPAQCPRCKRYDWDKKHTL